MRLIEDCTVGESDGGSSGRNVVVGVKLELESRELLTWALVKVAHPGDLVIALHVLETVPESTSSLLSLVKAFDSVLSVYEGFCNLKQVHLKLKVCRGSPVRKIIKREAESYGEATVVVGTSKSYHGIRSSVSVAEYCGRKLSKDFGVFAVSNGKIVFSREAINKNGDKPQDKDADQNCVPLVSNSLNQSVEVLNEAGVAVKSDRGQYGSRKSCPCCRKFLKRNVFRNGSALIKELPHNYGSECSLALVPTRESSQPKSSWSVIRRVFVRKQQPIEKSVRNRSMFQGVLKVPSFHSSAIVYPDQKQGNSDEDRHPAIVVENGAIVPFGYGAFCPSLSTHHSIESLPKELVDLHDKYSSTCRLFSYHELLSATSNFLPENMIGKGGSSHVYRGSLPDGKELAVKILKQSEDVLKEFVQEIEIITTLNHKNIISLFGFCFEDSKLLLSYDFLSRGSLEENLHGNKKDASTFGWQERFKVAVGVAEALDYLHNGCAEPVIHRDVKSSNILLSDAFEPQLSDFGFACWASTSSQITCTEIAGTFGYLAPEYFMHGKVSDKLDVYAFGVVLLELLSGRKPINSAYPKGQESLVIWAKPILKEGKVSQLLDPDLGGDYNHDQIGRMILAATLCIRHAPKLRPQINLVLKLLQGDEEVTNWARQQVFNPEELDDTDEQPLLSNNIQSHLNLVLLDLEDDSLSVSSNEQNISLEDYLQSRWSRSSSLD